MAENETTTVNAPLPREQYQGPRSLESAVAFGTMLAIPGLTLSTWADRLSKNPKTSNILAWVGFGAAGALAALGAFFGGKSASIAKTQFENVQDQRDMVYHSAMELGAQNEQLRHAVGQLTNEVIKGRHELEVQRKQIEAARHTPTHTAAHAPHVSGGHNAHHPAAGAHSEAHGLTVGEHHTPKPPHHTPGHTAAQAATSHDTAAPKPTIHADTVAQHANLAAAHDTKAHATTDAGHGNHASHAADKSHANHAAKLDAPHTTHAEAAKAAANDTGTHHHAA